MKKMLPLALAVFVAPLLTAAEHKPLPKDLPPFGEDKPLPVPAITQSKLPNGLTVWVVKRAGYPRVVVKLAVRGGSASDPKDAPGISDLLADTLKEGTATRTSRQIAEELQSVGAEIGADESSDAIYVTGTGLGSGAPKILEIVADIALHPAFPAAEVELAKGNALEGLKAQESTPGYLAQKALAQAIYGDHPYRVIGATKETLQAATVEQLKKEHARRFRPEGALLVVVGDVNTAAVTAAVNKFFGTWKATGEALAATPPSPAATARRLLVVNRPGSVQSQILLGRPVATVTDPAYYPLLVANTICAGSFGSRLTENIREDKGYTYSPGGGVQARAQGGLLTVRADVRTEVTAASLMEIFYELDRMGATAPTTEELSRAKRYQGGLYLLRNQIQNSVAQTLASNWVNGLPPEALGEFVTKVNAVTADQVREAGRTFYPSALQTVVVVGDEPKVKAELAQFGTADTVKP
ncbi:MAG TPA: pitrilysin family protein [Vicinamibacteria bacterium]